MKVVKVKVVYCNFAPTVPIKFRDDANAEH